MTRKNAVKSFALKPEQRKLTPPPDIKNKFVGTPKILKPVEERGRSLGMEADDQKKTKTLSIPTNLPLINPIKKLELVRPSSSKARILNVNSEKDKEQIYERYKFLVKSGSLPRDRVVNYLILCIRGLHYSTQCLKEPSKKFINSRKLKIPQTALSTRS